MARIPKCMCPNCNNIGSHKIQVFRRGEEGHAFLCDYHFFNEESYFTKNNNKQGTNKAHGYTFGVEFETSYTTKKARIEFTASGYLPTQDATVDVEYKSGIMNGLNSLSKHCVTFERLMNDGDLRVGNECGTHFHIGNAEKLNAETLQYIRRFYHSLFIPLQEAMQTNPMKTEQLFGRGFGHWCSPINTATNPMNHTNFINMQHSNTIEFRMCMFKNAKQYMNCAKFCADVVKCVVANFVEHFNDEDIDNRRYNNMTEYRKHKASVTAKKLVKLFEKYTNN